MILLSSHSICLPINHHLAAGHGADVGCLMLAGRRSLQTAGHPRLKATDYQLSIHDLLLPTAMTKRATMLRVHETENMDSSFDCLRRNLLADGDGLVLPSDGSRTAFLRWSPCALIGGSRSNARTQQQKG